VDGITWGTWKKGSWGWSIAPEMLHVSMGYVSWAQTARTSKRPLGRATETWHVLVGVRFWGSCFVVCGFWPAETNAMLPLKHDTFPCQFALGPSMPVCGSSCRAASKWAMHLRLVTEITTGIDKMYLLCPHPEYQKNPIQSKQSKHFHQRNRFT
jgi:hypothetical protein